MKIALKILKNFLYVVALAFALYFIINWVKGISGSLFADDVISAQNRTAASYYFFLMIPSGIGILLGLVPTIFIKEEGLPEMLIKWIKIKTTSKTELKKE